MKQYAIKLFENSINQSINQSIRLLQNFEKYSKYMNT